MGKWIGLTAIAVVAVLVMGCSSVPWGECATDAEAAYFEAQSDTFAEIRDQINAMGELNSEVVKDPYVILDQKWLASAREVAADAEAITEKVVAMDPPPSVEDLHTNLTDVANRHQSAMALYVRGAAGNNVSYVTQSAQLMTDTGTVIDRMRERTENFCK